jgi:hypothetical protein
VTVVLLCSILGINFTLNNSINNGVFYPKNNSYSYSDNWLSQSYMNTSVINFCGTFIALLTIAIIYQLIAIAIRFLNIGLINNNIKYFYGIDIFFNSMMVYVMMCAAFGCYSVDTIISYRDMFGNQLTTDVFLPIHALMQITAVCCCVSSVISLLLVYFTVR